MITTLSETTPTARKTHHCELCGKTINAGDRYINQRNCDGDTAWTWKAHEQCRRLMGSFGDAAGICQMDWDDGIVVDRSEFRRFLATYTDKEAD